MVVSDVVSLSMVVIQTWKNRVSKNVSKNDILWHFSENGCSEDRFIGQVSGYIQILVLILSIFSGHILGYFCTVWNGFILVCKDVCFNVMYF